MWEKAELHCVQKRGKEWLGQEDVPFGCLSLHHVPDNLVLISMAKMREGEFEKM